MKIQFLPLHISILFPLLLLSNSSLAESFQCFFTYESTTHPKAKVNSATCTGVPEHVFSSTGTSAPRQKHCALTESSMLEKLIDFEVNSNDKTVRWVAVTGRNRSIQLPASGTIVSYTVGKEVVHNHMGKHYKNGKELTNRIITFVMQLDDYNGGNPSHQNYTLYIPGANENAILAQWSVFDHESSWVDLKFGKCKKL